jgi:hypothetical protein
MSSIQTLLIIVIISLAILLMVVGVQVFLAILDLRKAIRRLNAILEDSVIGGGLLRPEKLTGILEMFGKKKKMESHGEQV